MNYFDSFTWEKMLNLYPGRNYNTAEYHKILSPEYPDFLDKYLELPVLKRLAGIGLLCGTDWTPLYQNRFYYSRLDHSVGVALIIWHFTHDKAQTIAGLLHDVSTPVFSHVSDFRKGDALTQTITEEDNTSLIRKNAQLLELLKADGLTVEQVENYHIYPIADNEIPQLSADRLEYMYPSGMALEGSWTLDEVAETYNDLVILKNEAGQNELGFKTLELAEKYCYKFCMTGHVLQLNENKLTLQLLGQIMNKAVSLGVLSEADFMTLSEKEILQKLDEAEAAADLKNVGDSCRAVADSKNSGATCRAVADLKNGTDSHCAPADSKNSADLKNVADPCRAVAAPKNGTDSQNAAAAQDNAGLFRLYHTFRTMKTVEHTDCPKNPEEYFCVSLKVKQRYINPLVVVSADRQNGPAASNDSNSLHSAASTKNAATPNNGTAAYCAPADPQDDAAIGPAATTLYSKRLSEVSQKAGTLIQDFLKYQDTAFGCVKLI